MSVAPSSSSSSSEAMVHQAPVFHRATSIKYTAQLRKAWKSITQDDHISAGYHRLYDPYFMVFISRLQAAQRDDPSLDPMEWKNILSLELIISDVRLFACMYICMTVFACLPACLPYTPTFYSRITICFFHILVFYFYVYYILQLS